MNITMATQAEVVKEMVESLKQMSERADLFAGEDESTDESHELNIIAKGIDEIVTNIDRLQK